MVDRSIRLIKPSGNALVISLIGLITCFVLVSVARWYHIVLIFTASTGLVLSIGWLLFNSKTYSVSIPDELENKRFAHLELQEIERQIFGSFQGVDRV